MSKKFSAFKHSTAPVRTSLINEVNPAQANFETFFETKPLGEKEIDQLYHILIEESTPNVKRMVANHLDQLKKLTEEIRSIDRQGLILMGERIEKARNILSNYGDKRGAFTKWLSLTFRSRQTAYNIMAYYELHKSLPSLDVQDSFKKIPQKAAYVLASREGDLKKKIKIILEHHSDAPEEFIKLVRKTFPLEATDKRKQKEDTAATIGRIRLALRELKDRRRELSKASLKEIGELRFLIEDIIS